MDRKQELLEIFNDVGNKEVVIKLIDEVIFLEEQLFELKKLPMIKIHPVNKELSKPTPASKLYKEFLQQYNSTVKNLSSYVRKEEAEEESPLEAYLKSLNN